MAGPLIPLLGLVAEFIMANGTRAAAMRYGPKAVEKGLKEIKRRQSAINKRVSEKRAKGEIPPREQTAAQIEARLANQRARRMRSEEPRPRFDEEGFPIDEVPLQFAEGDVVNAGLGSLMSESGRTMSNMDMMMADQAARQGISPAEQRMIMIQRTAADMGRTISDRDAQLFGMGEISFEEAMSRAMPSMDRVSGERNLMQQEQMFFPERKSFRDSQQAFKGTPLGDALSYVPDLFQVADYMGLKNFAAGDEVDVDALPKGLKAMYDSGPKGREGVEKIAAKTDKFAEGDEVSSNVLGQFSEELPLTNYIMSLSNPEQSELLRSLIGVSGIAVGSIESIPMLIKRLVSTGSLKSPAAQAVIKESMDMQERKKMAEGGAVGSEIDKALEEIQGAAPDAMVIQQVMTMVMEMMQSGASEEQIMQALIEMGLDEEDIQQVMMMVAEEMAGQDSIDGQLAQMM